MSDATIAGLFLIGVPLAFNIAFALLGARFDYPDILRQPTSEVLARFRAGGTSARAAVVGFALTAVLLAPLVVLLSRRSTMRTRRSLAVATTVGVLAGARAVPRPVRWPFLVPYLARAAADPDASPARREAVDVVFQSFNRYLGVAVGEHLGYLLTGAWTPLTGVALTQTGRSPWLGVAGIVIGPLLMLCSLEFVGRTSRTAGRSPAPDADRLLAWSLWLVATGIALLISSETAPGAASPY